MYGRDPKPAPHNIKRSSRGAALALQRYLNGQFVGPRTRQTVGPMRALLSNDARKLLGPRDRRALGLGMRRIVGGKTISAKTRAVVLYQGSNAYAVTLRYTAIMNVVFAGDRTHRMAQSGIMVLRPTKAGPWRAEMVDVTLRMRPLGQPKPRPTASESEPSDGASEGGPS